MSVLDEQLARRPHGATGGVDWYTWAVRLWLLQLPVALLLVLMVVAAATLDVPIGAFTRDPAAISGISPFNWCAFFVARAAGSLQTVPGGATKAGSGRA